MVVLPWDDASESDDEAGENQEWKDSRSHITLTSLTGKTSQPTPQHGPPVKDLNKNINDSNVHIIATYVKDLKVGKGGTNSSEWSQHTMNERVKVMV
jgi:hypothetical protein